MPWAGVAVRAAMFAAAIGIDAMAKGNVGTVVLGGEAAGGVGEELCGNAAIAGVGVSVGIGVVLELFPIGLETHGFEAVGGLDLSAAADEMLFGLVGAGGHGDSL